MSRGFSLIEVLMVLVIVTILTGASYFFLSAHQRLFKPDEQATILIDMLQEARQRSLTQRETMRVEIDLTDNVARLIDENTSSNAPGPDTVENDSVVRQVTLLRPSEVTISVRPPDISENPPETLSVPAAQFKPSIYPSSVSHNVCTIRFLRNGTVVNEGTNAIGANASLTGLTLFVWSPKPNEEGKSQIARAMTIIGATGSIRLWEYNRDVPSGNKWKDSRRTGVYGGQTSNSNTSLP